MKTGQRANPGEGVTFRPWRKGDIPVLVRLCEDLYAHIESIDPVWRTSPNARDHVRVHLTDLMNHRYAMTFLASCQQEVVGFITGSIVQRPPVILPHRDGLVDNAYVKPAFRNAGIGTRLSTLLMDWFADQGVEEVRIHYQVSNQQGAAFWERQGFKSWTMQAHLWLHERGTGNE